MVRRYTEAELQRRYQAGDRIELGGVYFTTAEAASRLASGLVEIADRATGTYRRLLRDPAEELSRITEALALSRPSEPDTGNHLR
jgi:hypothetical protein